MDTGLNDLIDNVFDAYSGHSTSGGTTLSDLADNLGNYEKNALSGFQKGMIGFIGIAICVYLISYVVRKSHKNRY